MGLMYVQSSVETWWGEESVSVLQCLSQSSCIFFGLPLSCYSAPFLPPSDVADGLGWHRWLSTTCCKFFAIFCYVTPFIVVVVVVCKGWLEMRERQEEGVKWCWCSVLSCFLLCHCWDHLAAAGRAPANKGSRLGTLASVVEKVHLYYLRVLLSPYWGTAFPSAACCEGKNPQLALGIRCRILLIFWIPLEMK